MHLIWTINVGEIITCVVTVASLIYALGRLTQRIDGIAATCDERHEDFQNHEREDLTRIEGLNQRLAYLQRAKGK